MVRIGEDDHSPPLHRKLYSPQHGFSNCGAVRFNCVRLHSSLNRGRVILAFDDDDFFDQDANLLLVPLPAPAQNKKRRSLFLLDKRHGR